MRTYPTNKQWVRINNFHHDKHNSLYPDYNYIHMDYKFECDQRTKGVVSFLNLTPVEAMVRCIKIVRYVDNTVKIVIEPSPLKYDEFYLQCHRYLHCSFQPVTLFNHLNKPYNYVIELTGNSSSVIDLLKFLEIVNFYSEIEEFPSILLNELSAIHGYLNGNPLTHCIPEVQLPSSWVRKDQYPSPNKILNLFMRFNLRTGRLDTLEIQLKQVLAQGENPNYLDADQMSPLYWATKRIKSPDVIKLLLCYGAEILVSNTWNTLTPIEDAKRNNNLACYDLLNTVYQQSKIIPSNPASKFRVETIDHVINNGIINSYIRFTNNLLLNSELKKMSSVCSNELEQLFELYAGIYQATPDDIRKSFADTFAPAEGKLVTILREQSRKIIGAVTYAIQSENNEVYVLVDQSFLHPDYQGIGIMPLFDYQIPFALQALYNKKTFVLFLAASYNAWRRVEHIPCVPKYHNEGSKNQIKHLFNDLFKCPISITDTPDGVFFTAKEETQLAVIPAKKAKTSIMEDFFNTHLRAAGAGYVPVLIPVAEDLLVVLQNMLQGRGVHFKDQYQLLAKSLSQTNLLKTSTSKSMFSSKSIFWNNQNTAFKDASLNSTKMVSLVQSKL